MIDIVRQLLDACLDSHAVLQVVDLADLEAQRRQAAGRDAVMVVSDCPPVDLVARFAAATEPVLVCCDAFDVVVRYNMASRGMALAPALRFATQVLSALDGLAGLPHVMRLTHRRDADPLRAVVASIAAFLGLDPPAERFDAAMRRLGEEVDAAPPSFRRHVERRFPHRQGEDDGLSPGDEATLRSLATCYGPLVEGEAMAEAAWPVRLLLDWDHAGRFLAGAVPLLGPARFVVCGPYLHLPAGSWRLLVAFATHDCRSDNRIEAEVYDGRVLAAVALLLPRAGRFSFALPFGVDDPLRPLELRVRLATGAIEGTLEILRLDLACLARRAGPAPEAQMREVA